MNMGLNPVIRVASSVGSGGESDVASRAASSTSTSSYSSSTGSITQPKRKKPRKVLPPVLRRSSSMPDMVAALHDQHSKLGASMAAGYTSGGEGTNDMPSPVAPPTPYADVDHPSSNHVPQSPPLRTATGATPYTAVHTSDYQAAGGRPPMMDWFSGNGAGGSAGVGVGGGAGGVVGGSAVNKKAAEPIYDSPRALVSPTARVPDVSSMPDNQVACVLSPFAMPLPLFLRSLSIESQDCTMDSVVNSGTGGFGWIAGLHHGFCGQQWDGGGSDGAATITCLFVVHSLASVLL
jgi:hypothetical protein